MCDPDEEIAKPWQRTWLPLFANGGGDYVVYETDKRALRHYHHDDKHGPVFAKSLVAAVRAIAAEHDVPSVAEVGDEWIRLAERPSRAAFAKKPPGTVYRFSRTSNSKRPVLFLLWKYARDRWLDQPSNKNSIDEAWRLIETKRVAAATNSHATESDNYIYYGRLELADVLRDGDAPWVDLYESYRALPK